jgi:hypothetical protein
LWKENSTKEFIMTDNLTYNYILHLEELYMEPVICATAHNPEHNESNYKHAIQISKTGCLAIYGPFRSKCLLNLHGHYHNPDLDNIRNHEPIEFAGSTHPLFKHSIGKLQDKSYTPSPIEKLLYFKSKNTEFLAKGCVIISYELHPIIDKIKSLYNPIISTLNELDISHIPIIPNPFKHVDTARERMQHHQARAISHIKGMRATEVARVLKQNLK